VVWSLVPLGARGRSRRLQQMWGDEFGMCVDQYGVTWMVNIAQPQS
jgi:PhnB protein